MAQVSLEHICKTYDKTPVITDLNLTVLDQEFMVLVGPSGCGKTTVLRMIAGLESITQGVLKIDSHPMNAVAPKDRDIAMVFQSYALYPHMSVFDNMAFGLKMRKAPKAEIRSKVEEAARILDLTHVLDRKPKQLSGGQRQRVALGRAIVRNPKVFLMDEPLSNLDAKFRVQMRTEILKLHRRLHATTIYVTHDQTEAMTMGDRIAVFNAGHIQQLGQPETLYNQPANMFVGGFIGSMQFMPAQYDAGQLLLKSGLSWPLPKHIQTQLTQKGVADKPLQLGIRPEHFSTQAQATGTQSVSVTPEIIELLGHQKLVHFSLADQTLVAALPPETAVTEGSPLTLYLDLNKTCYFDPQTEANLLH